MITGFGAGLAGVLDQTMPSYMVVGASHGDISFDLPPRAAFAANADAGAHTGTNAGANNTGAAFTRRAASQRNMPACLRNTSPDPLDPGKKFPRRYARAETLPPPKLTIVPHADGAGGYVGHVAYGNVSVPPFLQHDYEGVRRYMLATPRGRTYLAQFEAPDSIAVKIEPYLMSGVRSHGADDLTSKACYDPQTSTIKWNPREAIFTETGGVQSAAATLAHEIGHAVRRARGQKIQHRSSELRRYSNTEEYHVITKLENELALTHGEGLRDSHNIVVSYETTDVAGTVPKHYGVMKILQDRYRELKLLTSTLHYMDQDLRHAPRTPHLADTLKKRDAVVQTVRQEIYDYLTRPLPPLPSDLQWLSAHR